MNSAAQLLRWVAQCEPEMTEIKICGLTNKSDAVAALEMGADYLGFILYSGSPRGISAEDLRGILDNLGGIRNGVGVFVNESPSVVAKVAADCALCAVQMHGDEPVGAFDDFPLPVWRAVTFRDGACCPDPSSWLAERYVVDAAVPGVYGGSGVTADWKAAAEMALRRPVMLAGGLTSENVAAAIRTVQPLGVDTASGVEAEPGRKDHSKMEAFIRAVRA